MSAETAAVVAEFKSMVDQLREQCRASRTTIRLDMPAHGFQVNGVVAESCAPGVNSIASTPTLHQRSTVTASWLERHRRILVQNDFSDPDLQPPQALIAQYGTRAQMMAPVERDGALTGWISVHYNAGPRDWSAADVAALESAVKIAHAILDRA